MFLRSCFFYIHSDRFIVSAPRFQFVQLRIAARVSFWFWPVWTFILRLANDLSCFVLRFLR